MIVNPVQMAWDLLISSFTEMDKTIDSSSCTNRVTMGVGGVHWDSMQRRFWSNSVAVMVPQSFHNIVRISRILMFSHTSVAL